MPRQKFMSGQSISALFSKTAVAFDLKCSDAVLHRLVYFHYDHLLYYIILYYIIIGRFNQNYKVNQSALSAVVCTPSRSVALLQFLFYYRTDCIQKFYIPQVF